ARGGYVLSTGSAETPDVVLIATGSELQLAVAAAAELEAEGTAARVVSMPCLDWVEAQPRAYRDAVIPPTVRARVSGEAGVAMPWRGVLGDCGEAVSLEHFGASADYKTLFREFGITADAAVAAAKRSIAAVPAANSKV